MQHFSRQNWLASHCRKGARPCRKAGKRAFHSSEARKGGRSVPEASDSAAEPLWSRNEVLAAEHTHAKVL